MVIAIVHGNAWDGHAACSHPRRGIFSPGHGDRQFMRGTGQVVAVLEFTTVRPGGDIVGRLLRSGFLAA